MSRWLFGWWFFGHHIVVCWCTHTPHTGMSWYEAGSCPHAVHLHFVENISFIFISTCISTVFWDQLSILFWLVRLHGFVISSLSHLFPRRVCSHHLLVFIKNFLLFTFKCSVFCVLFPFRSIYKQNQRWFRYDSRGSLDRFFFSRVVPSILDHLLASGQSMS